MTFYVGDQTTKASPGSLLFGPKDGPHAFTVGSGPARLLFILSPAGMEGLIREMGEPARSLSIPPPPEEPPDEAEMERLMAIAARYGGEMLGPPSSQWEHFANKRRRAVDFGTSTLLLTLFDECQGRGVLGNPRPSS
jgi:hypothetical protein